MSWEALLSSPFDLGIGLALYRMYGPRIVLLRAVVLISKELWHFSKHTIQAYTNHLLFIALHYLMFLLYTGQGYVPLYPLRDEAISVHNMERTDTIWNLSG